jgi:hypothetical protein
MIVPPSQDAVKAFCDLYGSVLVTMVHVRGYCKTCDTPIGSEIQPNGKGLGRDLSVGK